MTQMTQMTHDEGVFGGPWGPGGLISMFCIEARGVPHGSCRFLYHSSSASSASSASSM
jgi:hypothetical protein